MRRDQLSHSRGTFKVGGKTFDFSALMQMFWCFLWTVSWLSKYFYGSASLSDITCLPNINLQFCIVLLWQPDQYLKHFRKHLLLGFKSHWWHYWEQKLERTKSSGMVVVWGGSFSSCLQIPLPQLFMGHPHALQRKAELCVTLFSIYLLRCSCCHNMWGSNKCIVTEEKSSSSFFSSNQQKKL